MKRVLQALLVIAIAVAGFFAYRILFPDDAEVIRRQLAEMATEASFEGGESPLTRVSKAGKLAGYFTVDSRIEVRPWGYRQVTVNGRAEIREATIGARTMVTSLKILLDRVDVSVAPDRDSAQVVMSMVVESSRQEDPWYQDMEVQMNRIDGDWLIHRVRNREFIKH